MFSNEQKKIIKEASKNGPLIIKGFNYNGIPFVVTGELADSKNSNCHASITDTNISIVIKLSEDLDKLGFNQRLSHFLHESKNMFIELASTPNPNKQLDGSHLYISCIANCDGQIIYVNNGANIESKNIENILIAEDGTYFESEDEIDEVSKVLYSYIGKPICLEDHLEKRKIIGVPVSLTMFRNIGRSKVVIARDNTISFYQVTPSTKLYDLSNNEAKLIAENDPTAISEMQKKLTQRLLQKKPPKHSTSTSTETTSQKQPGSEE